MSCSFAKKLEAFASSALPDDERRDVLAHLPSCPACREEAARLASLRRVLANLSPYEPEDAEWRRIDRAVLKAMDSALEEQRAPATTGWLDAWLPAFSMAAASAVVLLATFVGLSSPVPPEAPRAEAARSGAVAVALGDGVRVVEPGGASHLLTGGAVDEGDALEVADAALTLQTAPATGVRLAPRSRVGLDRLALGRTSFRVDSGELAAEVKPLAAGATFQVRAADLLVSVRGTAFRVVREVSLTRVEVAHGLVLVEREGGGAVLVPGPGSVEVPDGAPLVAEIVKRTLSPETETAFPLGLTDRPLSELAALPPQHVEPPAPALEPAASAPVAVAALAPAPQPARLSQARAVALREAFSACLREPTRSGALASCYEHALNRDRSLTGSLTLTVSIDRDGAVRSVEASRTSAGFLSCAQQIVRRCEQPGTGEDVQLELPLELSH